VLIDNNVSEREMKRRGSSKNSLFVGNPAAADACDPGKLEPAPAAGTALARNPISRSVAEPAASRRSDSRRGCPISRSSSSRTHRQLAKHSLPTSKMVWFTYRSAKSG